MGGQTKLSISKNSGNLHNQSKTNILSLTKAKTLSRNILLDTFLVYKYIINVKMEVREEVTGCTVTLVMLKLSYQVTPLKIIAFNFSIS